MGNVGGIVGQSWYLSVRWPIIEILLPGSAVNASFLFIVGLANSIILFRIIRKRQQVICLTRTLVFWLTLWPCKLKKERASRIERGEDPSDVDKYIYEQDNQGNTVMMKVIGPVVTFVNRPWKMYPVSVLFGFGQYCSQLVWILPWMLCFWLGFDTASSIALLSVSAIAKKGSDGKQIPPSHIVILPVSSILQ